MISHNLQNEFRTIERTDSVRQKGSDAFRLAGKSGITTSQGINARSGSHSALDSESGSTR